MNRYEMLSDEVIGSAESYNLGGASGGETIRNADSYGLDTREQLEADVREWIGIAAYKTYTPEWMLEVMLHWLDRQEAITERELDRQAGSECDRLQSVVKAQADSFAKLEAECRLLNGEREALESERERLIAERDEAVEKLDNAKQALLGTPF